MVYRLLQGVWCHSLASRKNFRVNNTQVARSKFFSQKVTHKEVEIAYHELLSAVIAFIYLAPFSLSSLVRINTDNKNVVSLSNKNQHSNKVRLSPIVGDQADETKIYLENHSFLHYILREYVSQ